jgi:hypothetical protein
MSDIKENTKTTGSPVSIYLSLEVQFKLAERAKLLARSRSWMVESMLRPALGLPPLTGKDQGGE